ncbi:MAG: hypothetical protein K5925_01735 [Bacilli bacterium]|nr:hypothetical protein [Bacilli bacterium]
MKVNKGLFILFTASLFTIAGCGGGSNSTELNKYQKVSKAFAAIGRTLDFSSNKSRSSVSPRAIDIHGDTSNFDTYFAGAEIGGEIEDQIDLNTPPFMQFQYLKIIYETIGSNYSFDTKYSHTITGDVYIDFETGYKDKDSSEANKYSFAFDLSVYINIDDNDLITSEVGMDITLTQGQKSYKYYKFALLILDYDFAKNDDNFELAMYDYGEDKDLAYLHCDYGYEYDYCLVSGGKLNEWRKLRYEADRKMFKDASHPTLDSYINEGAVITTSNQKWYKDNALKKVFAESPEALVISKEAYASFGLNSTDLNPEGYFAKASTDSNAIQTIYDQASRTYGDGLIYHIIAEEEDGSPEKSWPISEITQITGMDFTFSNRDDVTYSYYRDDKDGESASVVITVTGANAGEYTQFEYELKETYHFTKGEDQQGFHIYSMGLIDNTILSIYVSPSTNTIVFQHYFGGGSGGQGQYDPILLDNLFTYDLPYNYFNQTFYLFDKDALGDLADLLNDQDVNKIFANKINLKVSEKIEIRLIDKDIENVGGSSTLEQARDNVMNSYGYNYKSQWNETRISNGFLNTATQDLVVIRPAEDDGTFFIYLFRCVDDTMSKYLDGAIVTTYIDIPIYVHPHDEEVYLEKSISFKEGESVLSELDQDVKYYLDEGLTTLLTDKNCAAYEGMELHRRDYEDPEKISVPGGVDYELLYTWKLSNQMEDEEEIYNRVMNMVGDPKIRSYLEGHISSNNPTNIGYQIFIGDEVVGYLEKDDPVDAAEYLYAQYTKEYSNWNKGTKGDYFYTGEKEEDVVFFNKERLDTGMIEFIHIHLTSKVMANYEAGSQGGDSGEGGESGGGETPTTAQVTLYFYSNGTYNYADYITCPLGDNVKAHLNGIEGDFYLDDSFSQPLPDEYAAATGLIIHINVVSSQEEWTTFQLIIDGDSENPNVIEIRAKIGDDLYDYLTPYGDEFYLDSEYQYRITKDYCSVAYDMVVYARTNQGGEEDANKCSVNVYIYENGELVDQKQIKVTIHEDVSTEAYGLGIDGTLYADESLLTLLDNTNCYAYEGMSIYLDKTIYDPQTNDVNVTIYKFNSDYEKMGRDVIVCQANEDVRDYLRGYGGDIFLNSDFSEPLTIKNCQAYDGMELYIVIHK